MRYNYLEEMGLRPFLITNIRGVKCWKEQKDLWI